jgi:LmbE family N-acetylglucosaminyl deacetylase
MAMDLPVRRSRLPLAATDRPLALPHLESEREPFRFLGYETPLVGPHTLPLWRSCTGDRQLGSWPAVERETIAGWHAAGLVVGVGEDRAAAPGTAVVVSPHPDDAQLAVGGLLAARGGRVIDAFTEETWTRRPYYVDRPELSAPLLLAEERIACRVLGVEPTLLGHVDGAARGPWGDSVFLPDPALATPQDVEPELFAALVADLAAAIPPSGRVLTPLAVGGHVDHVLSREAVLALVRDGRLDAARVVFYEDMPYSVFGDAAAAAGALGVRADVGELRPVLVPNGTAEVKREALWAYRLQTTEGMILRVVRYGQRLAPDHGFAERLWLWRGAPATGLTERDRDS